MLFAKKGSCQINREGPEYRVFYKDSQFLVTKNQMEARIQMDRLAGLDGLIKRADKMLEGLK